MLLQAVTSSLHNFSAAPVSGDVGKPARNQLLIDISKNTKAGQALQDYGRTDSASASSYLAGNDSASPSTYFAGNDSVLASPYLAGNDYTIFNTVRNTVHGIFTFLLG